MLEADWMVLYVTERSVSKNRTLRESVYEPGQVVVVTTIVDVLVTGTLIVTGIVTGGGGAGVLVTA